MFQGSTQRVFLHLRSVLLELLQERFLFADYSLIIHVSFSNSFWLSPAFTRTCPPWRRRLPAGRTVLFFIHLDTAVSISIAWDQLKLVLPIPSLAQLDDFDDTLSYIIAQLAVLEQALPKSSRSRAVSLISSGISFTTTCSAEAWRGQLSGQTAAPPPSPYHM